MRRQTTIRVGGKKITLSREQLYALRQDVDTVRGGQNTRELCYSPCHTGHFQHVGSCRLCPVCGKNVLPEAFEAHTARHADAVTDETTSTETGPDGKPMN
jgi:hypothetical protein